MSINFEYHINIAVVSLSFSVMENISLTKISFRSKDE